MNAFDLVAHRLINQQLTGTTFQSVKEIVGWMGAMQAQDYSMVKWAISLRSPNFTEPAIEQAINRGEIIRTHVMRPTWHFISADDARWMLALSSPILRKALKSNHTKMGLTESLFNRCNSIIEKSLSRQKIMTREELVAELNKNKIKPDSLQTIHIMFAAELSALICNGPMRGKQFTYALIDERVPKAKSMSKEEALAKLAERYFTSHGPATLQDFGWWSGLPAADARFGLEAVKKNLINEKIDDQTYWFASYPEGKSFSKSLHFLPSYDEFLISYKNRSASLDPKFFSNAITSNGIFKPIIVIDGKVIGTWSREIKKDTAFISTHFFWASKKLKKSEMKKVLQSYGDFLDKKIELI